MTHRREGGFTVVEVVVAVVLLGLVVAPLSMALTQAITLLPESRDRSDVATQRRLLVDRFSDDVANATSVAFNWLLWCEESSSQFVARFSWTDGADRSAEYGWESSDARDGMVPVTMVRTLEVGGSVIGTDRYEVGYCSPGPVSIVLWFAAGEGHPLCPVTEHPRVCASLKLADRVDGTPVWYRMGGTQRTLDP